MLSDNLSGLRTSYSPAACYTVSRAYQAAVLFSLVPTVGDTFWAFGTPNKGLAWQQIAIKPGTNMAVLAWLWNVCRTIFSNISDFAVYECTMAHYTPSHRLWWLNKPLTV